MSELTYEHVRESNLIEGIDNVHADDDLWDAWGEMKYDGVLTVDNVLAAHRHLVRHQNDPTLPGLRTCRVWVGGREGAPWPQVPALLDEWLATYKTMTPREAHVAFECIHPFKDGNGRTGRLCLWHHEISLGQEPTLLRASRRQDYYDWFRT